jgi:uncharacterized protein (TIGR03437 family)
MPRLSVLLVLSAPAFAQPSINPGGVVNVSGEQPVLAPNAVFAVYGQNLGPSSIVVASAPNYPATLSGTSITFTPASGGPAITPKLVYSESIAVAGILPSSTPLGIYAVRVTYQNQTSAPQNVTIVAHNFNIATANGIGTGTAQATIGNVNGGFSLSRFTVSPTPPMAGTFTNTPAHPLDVVSLWGTGGGADPANDTGGSSGDQTAAGNFQVLLGGQTIVPAYTGAVAGYPGLWVLVFTVPAATPADCFTPLQVSSDGQLSNMTSLPVAATGQTSCSAQIGPATLSKLDNGGSIVMAAAVVGNSYFISNGATTTISSLGAIFNQYSASEFLIPYSGPTFGACRVLDETYPTGGKEPSYPDSILNAGSIQYSGPGISGSINGTTGGAGPVYVTSPTLQLGGTYSLTGLGGTQVAGFPTISATLPTSFSVTNFSGLTTVNRSQPLTISWTGSGFDQVLILIIDAVVTTSTIHGVTVSCAVDAGPGTYTIPAAALAYLPAGTAQVEVEAVKNNGGEVSAESSTSTTFTPPLVAGGKADFGSFATFLAYIQSAKIQ